MATPGHPALAPLSRSISTPTSHPRPPSPRRPAPAFAGEDLLYHDLDPEAEHYAADGTSLRRAKPGLDKLRGLDFCAPPNPELVCPICQCPFLGPVKLPACDHVFCADCLAQALAVQTSLMAASGAATLRCPLCRSPHARHAEQPMPRVFRNLLGELRTRCLNHERGCTVTMLRRDVRIHLVDDCRFVKVACVDAACGKPVLRRDVADVCQHEPVLCTRCGETVDERLKLNRHLEKDCAAHPGSCTWCDNRFSGRAELDAHVCDDEPIDCPGAPVGCTAAPLRQHLRQHTRTCVYVELQPALAAQATKIQDLELHNRHLEDRLDQLTRSVAALGSTRHAPAETPSPLSERQQLEFLQWQESVRAEIWREFELHREQLSERLTDMLVYHEGNLRSEQQNAGQAIHWLRADVDNLARIFRQARLLQGPAAAGPAAYVRAGPAAGAAGMGAVAGQPVRRMSDGSSRSDTKL